MISRSGWQAKAPRWTTRHRTPVNTVYIHHGGTHLSGHTQKDEASALQAYQRYHLRKGWADIAYSFAVGPQSGRVYELRGWNARPGATKGHNADSYSIVIIGNTSTQRVSEECVDSVRRLIEIGQRAGKITQKVQVLGHRDVKSTACPGDSAYSRLKDMAPGATPKTTVSKAPTYRRMLRLRRPRMRGNVVKWVQSIVGANPDGVYGPKTKALVQKWQRSKGLVADGIVGPKTYRYLSR